MQSSMDSIPRCEREQSMNVVPNYYHKFNCIADRCHHNCCIGWEIDIDDATMDYYGRISTDFGKKLLENIEYTDGVPHFLLRKKERCAFLLDSGLCEIISVLGEDALCDICTDHPRFRNFYEAYTEMGLGLCCEEAARIILSEEEPFSLVCGDALPVFPEEAEMLQKRNEVFSILQNRDEGILERLLKLAKISGFNNIFGLQKDIALAYLSLERLDDSWTNILGELSEYEFSGKIFSEKALKIPFEQLACYFIFRHFCGGIEDGDFSKRIKLTLSGCFLIAALCEKYMEDTGDLPFKKIVDFARMYSCEVEYSEENINALLNVL